MSDIHLGFQKHEYLQRIEQKVFERAIDECISRKVDFVLIPGDLFHVNIPEMRVQKFAFGKFREVHDAGIPVYVVYGSHDFSPVYNSVIDLLSEIGYVTKVTKASNLDDGRIALDFFTDKKTGAKIYGLSGLKVGRDREYYERLERESLEREPGFKIFLFHGGISDIKSGTDRGEGYMPLSLLPRGFSYYAGGHMHKFSHQTIGGYRHVVYPGTVFAGFHTDLEENARGERRGFVVVEFEDEVRDVSFVELKNSEYSMIEIDGGNRNADSVNAELLKKTQDVDPAGKIVMIKITGEMTSGKTSDIDVSAVRRSFYEKNAGTVQINKNQLSSLEYSITEAKGKNRDEIEANVFCENIGQVRSGQAELKGDAGTALAGRLLLELRKAKLDNESNRDYESRVRRDALGALGLNQDDS